MKKLVKSDLEESLFDIVKYPISLKQGYYYQCDNNIFTNICYSPFSIDLDVKNIVSTGQPILNKVGSETILLPPLFTVMTGVNKVELDPSSSNKITKGKNIKYSRLKNGIYIIIDNFKRPIALAVYQSGKIIPIVDVGIYLRKEDLS